VDSRIIQFFEKYDSDFYPPISQRTELTSYIESIFAHHGLLILFEIDGKIMGLIGFCIKNPLYQYYLQWMAVDKQHRGLGISKILMQAAANYIKQIGGIQIICRCWSTNTLAIQAYNKLGFVIIEIKLNDRSSGVHSYIFALDLMDGFILKPIQGMRLIVNQNAKVLQKIQSNFVEIDKEKNVLRSLIQSGNNPFEQEGKICKLEFLEASSSSISHLINLTYASYPTPELPETLPLECVNLLDYCSRYLEHLTFSFLVIQDKSEDLTNKIAYSNLIDLDPEHQQMVQNAIKLVNEGQNAKEFAKYFIELADKYSCDGLLIANNLFSGIYGNHKIVDGFVVIDPLRELAIHIGSQRMKMNFSFEKLIEVN
jgi:GNAT superfamily N-acetyltransferase